MATYKESKKLWEARRRLPGGQRKSFYAPTELQAEALADAATGKTTELLKATLNDVAKLIYIPTLTHHSLKWRRQVVWALDNHILPAIGHVPIEKLNRLTLQAFLSSKLSKLARKSVSHLRTVLFAIFNLAEADDLIQKNPVRFVKLPPARPSTKPGPPSMPDLRELLVHLKDHALYNTIRMSATLGLRRSEILGVRPGDYRGGILHIDRQRFDGQDHPLKTMASKRQLALPEGFPPLTADVSDAFLTRHVREVLPDGVRLHTLRHAFATGIEALGCPRAVTATILGHRRGTITDVYAQVGAETVRLWLTKWNDCLIGESRKENCQ